MSPTGVIAQDSATLLTLSNMQLVEVPDVQASVPTVRDLALARRRDRRGEGHPRPRRAALLRQARVLRRPRGRTRRARTCRASRRSSTTRSARSSSASRAFRAEQLAAAHRRARARAPGRAPRRGDDRGPLPRAQAGAGVGDPDPGDLHAVRLGRGHRSRHAPPGRRRRAGHDRLPVRPGARRRRRPRAAWPHDGFDEGQIEQILAGRPGGHPQPARPGHAAHRLPGGLRHRDRGARSC